MAKTQKAEGLRLCSVGFMDRVAVHVLDRNTTDYVPPDHWGPLLFVRPCPIRPRHGFLESRIVHRDNLKASLAEIWSEFDQIGEDGEVLVCPYINASLNAIITNGSITIGPGHDGATSGKGAITLPFPDVTVFNWNSEWGEPYIEAVKSHAWFATQFRGGPKVENELDFIVDNYKVERVYELRSDMDLVQWERIVKQFPPGTVVFHRGGAVTSHYGVHCVANGIPYFTTRYPRVGEVLKTNKKKPRGIIPRFRKYLETLRLNPAFASELAVASIYVLHNIPKMNREQAELLIPLFAAVWVRLGEALCFGEARHLRAHHRHECGVSEFSTTGLSRDYVYSVVMRKRVNYSLEVVWRCFSKCEWESSYGGPAWARCARSIIRMKKAATTKRLIEAWNLSVNLAHNTGWWFNKLIPKAVFDQIHTPQRSLAAAETIYRVLNPTPDGAYIDNAVFPIRWRYLVAGKIRVQVPEYNMEIDALIEPPQYVLENSDFKFQSTAGTDKMYAQAYIVVSKGDVFLRFELAHKNESGEFATYDLPLPCVMVSTDASPKEAIKAFLLGECLATNKLLEIE